VSVLVLISAALGAVAMLLFGVSREIGLRWRHRAVSQQLRAAQARVAELEGVKGQPLAVGGRPTTSSELPAAPESPPRESTTNS
jgi:hypothetical protein